MSSACSLWQNNRGTYVPPFFGVWEGRTYGPCTPLRAVGLRPTTRKFFEKNLTKNFSLSLPNLGAGIKASRPPQTPPPESGVRDLSAQALGCKRVDCFLQNPPFVL